MRKEDTLTDFELALLFVKQHVDNNPYIATKEQIELLSRNEKIRESGDQQLKTDI